LDILVELEPHHSLQALIDRDHDLLAEVHDGARPECLRLWMSPPGLVITRRDAKHDKFAQAAERFETPIAVRRTGGGAVGHGPDCLNVSLIRSEPRTTSFCPDRHYLALADFVTQHLPIPAVLAPVIGAYCPGDHDLQAGGKKIAGLAQRVRTGKTADGAARRTTLSHLTLMVQNSSAGLIARINQFYEALGDPRRFDPAVSASLEELTGQPLHPQSLARSIADQTSG